MRAIYTLLLFGLLIPFAAAADETATLRKSEITMTPKAPPVERVENRDKRRQRNYPMQPPTVPHSIEGYVIDLNSNKCLTCHHRRRTNESQAPMVSVTHYMDRDGNFLAEISPRRYFCNQCHIHQTEARPLVGNSFQDVDAILKNKK